MSPDVVNMANVTSQLLLGSPCLGPPSTGITGSPLHPPGIYMGSGAPNSLPYSFRASALSTEPSPLSFIFGLLGSICFLELELTAKPSHVSINVLDTNQMTWQK